MSLINVETLIAAEHAIRAVKRLCDEVLRARHGHFDEIYAAVGAPESAVAVDQRIELRHGGFAPKTVGAGKGYHTAEFVTGLREQKIVPHPTRKDGQKNLHVLRTLAHAISQKVRKRIEEIFGWTKPTGCLRKSRYRGVERTHAQGQYVVAAWHLVRMARLLGGGPPKAVRAYAGRARGVPAPRAKAHKRCGPRRSRRGKRAAEPGFPATITKTRMSYIKTGRFSAVC